MRTLILLRHAKAVRETEAESDRARVLTERGHLDAAAAGAAIRAAGLKPALLLVSPAARTLETAALTGFASVETLYEERLYHASASTIWEAAAEADVEHVMVVGHNPGLQELVARLVESARDHSRAGRALAGDLPTSAFAAFEIEGARLSGARVRLLASWRPERRDE